MIAGTQEYKDFGYHLQFSRYGAHSKIRIKDLVKDLPKKLNGFAFWISLIAGSISIIQVIA